MNTPNDNDRKTTKRDPETDAVQEGGLPKDRKTAEAGDNRSAGDLDGNTNAAKREPPPRKP
jgi:hypothetical protein